MARVELTAALKIGDTIYIKGHTTDFQQTVESLQVDRNAVQEAAPGQSTGLKVTARCRRNDVIYRLTAAEVTAHPH